MSQGKWGLWSEQPQPMQAELRKIYCELREEFDGLPSRASRRYAKAAAEIWHSTERVSEEAVRLAGFRRHGRGRKPTSQKVRLQVKRQAMQMQALDSALAKLGALVSKERTRLALVRRA